MPAIRFAGLSLVAITGIAGLAADTWPEKFSWSVINLNAVFGATLLSMILVSLRARRAEGLCIASAQDRCRRLSRQVYLLLYGMVAACQLMRLASERPAAQPPEILRDYFVYGILALLAMRVLAVLSVRRLPAQQMSPRLAPAEDGAAPR